MVLITCLVIGVMLIAHRNVGRAAGRQVLRRMAAALSGFATSSYVLSLMLARAGLLVAYGGAFVCAQIGPHYQGRRPVLANPIDSEYTPFSL